MLILKNLVNPVQRLLLSSFLLPDYPFAILYPFRWGPIFPEGGEICLFPRAAHPSKSEPY